MVTTIARKYPGMEASLVVSIPLMIKPIFVKYPAVRSHSNNKVIY